MDTWTTTVTNVSDNTTKPLTQLFPPWCTAGTGLTTTGTERRSALEGHLFQLEVYASGAQGGYLEIWDVKGETEGGTNNVDTGTSLTAAYVAAKAAQTPLPKAKLLWTQGFSGDTGTTPKKITQHLPVSYGLAARFVNNTGGDGTIPIVLNIVSNGLYRKTAIVG